MGPPKWGHPVDAVVSPWMRSFPVDAVVSPWMRSFPVDAVVSQVHPTRDAELVLRREAIQMATFLTDPELGVLVLDRD